MLKIITRYIKKVEVVETNNIFGVERVREVFFQEIKEETKGSESDVVSIVGELKTK